MHFDVIILIIIKFMMTQQQQLSDKIAQCFFSGCCKKNLKLSKPNGNAVTNLCQFSSNMIKFCGSNGFRFLQALCESHSYSLEENISGSKKIKVSMVRKLVIWLKKVSFDALEFSNQTLQLALRILVRFLKITDESVSNLQLVGCVCLHISSKICQKTIVSSQVYCSCALNLFTTQQFEQKQQQMLELLGSVQKLPTSLKINSSLSFNSQFTQNETKFVQQSIMENLTEPLFLQESPLLSILAIMSLIHRNKEKPKFDDIMGCLKKVTE